MSTFVGRENPVEDIRLFSALDKAIQRDTDERSERAIRRMIESRLEALTPRERQVMELVIQGRLNKQIAAQLGMGEKTVKVHRGRVMSKMNVRSVAELVQLAARVGVQHSHARTIASGPNDPIWVQRSIATA